MSQPALLAELLGAIFPYLLLLGIGGWLQMTENTKEK